MKAATYARFGPADVVKLNKVPTPAPAADEVLVRVAAASVTTADWRIRAAAFPGIMWLPGHLMFGFRRPKTPILGTSMAGTVVATGRDLTRFRIGQRVFGFVDHGGHAEFITVKQSAALLGTPDFLSDAQAASLPFGANSALVFLRDIARLTAGQHVLIIGASGAVGSYATQIAKAMSAQVTAVAGPGRADMLQRLGADRVIDYRQENPAAAYHTYDVVLDTIGTTDWPQMRRALKPGGVFIPLNFGARDLWHMLRAKLTGGPRVAISVSGDTAEDLETLVEWIAQGKLQPVIDSVFPFDRIVEAYGQVETRHSAGTVIVEMTGQVPQAQRA